jgi:hypothetical protein
MKFMGFISAVLLTLLGLFLLIALSDLAHGQPIAGTVSYSASEPRKGVKAALSATTPETPPVISCTVTGNRPSATAIIVSCQVKSTPNISYQVPLSPGQSYTFDEHFGTADAVTVTATGSASGIQVTATANQSPVAGGPF